MRIDYRIDRPVRFEASFELEGFTVLLGQSGEGKTTLLRAWFKPTLHMEHG